MRSDAGADPFDALEAGCAALEAQQRRRSTGAHTHPAAAAAAGRPRWTRCADWAACPIGMLPSGVMPCLEVFRRPHPASWFGLCAEGRSGGHHPRVAPPTATAADATAADATAAHATAGAPREGPASWEETVIEDDPFTAPPPPERRLPAASPVDAAPDDAVAAAPRKRKRIEQSVLVEMQSGVGLL
jgi:hypothetical protein